MEPKLKKSELGKSKEDAEVEEKSTTDATDTIDAVDAMVNARREFNVHFTTFWHLVHLATYNSGLDHIETSWRMLSTVAGVWKKDIGSEGWWQFNCKMTNELDSIHKKLRGPEKLTMDEKSILVVTNYDECLEIVKMFGDQLHHDQVNAAAVCDQLLYLYRINFETFKRLPLLWNHFFIARIHQLLVLAKNCYSTSTSDDPPSLPHWLFTNYTTLTENLHEHFSKPTSATSNADWIDSTDSKLFSPTVPLYALIATLNGNAKCAAEQIPTALSSIMHDYCYLDPFSFDDAEFIKMKLVTSNKD